MFVTLGVCRYVFVLKWTHQNWTEFYERCKRAIETFNVLVARVHDIYSNRILNVLMWMQDVSLQVLPGGKNMYVHLKIHTNHNYYKKKKINENKNLKFQVIVGQSASTSYNL